MKDVGELSVAGQIDWIGLGSGEAAGSLPMAMKFKWLRGLNPRLRGHCLLDRSQASITFQEINCSFVSLICFLVIMLTFQGNALCCILRLRLTWKCFIG